MVTLLFWYSLRLSTSADVGSEEGAVNRLAAFLLTLGMMCEFMGAVFWKAADSLYSGIYYCTSMIVTPCSGAPTATTSVSPSSSA